MKQEQERGWKNVRQSFAQGTNEHQMTQTEIGKMIGKSKQWVSEFERGNIRLNLDVAVELASVLGLAADVFLPRKSKNISR